MQLQISVNDVIGSIAMSTFFRIILITIKETQPLVEEPRLLKDVPPRP